MKHYEWTPIFADKLIGYDAPMCGQALADCHATLRIRSDLAADDPYYIKLWAEIDALRERQLSITKGTQ